VLEHGIGKLFKKASPARAPCSPSHGKGKIYLADGGKKVTVIRLENEAISVNGSDLLAFEPSVTWDIAC